MQNTETKALFGTIFHTEMRSSDPAATAQFLASVFGWQTTDTPHPAYKLFENSDGFEGHIGPVPGEDAGPSATNYVLVTDIEAAEQAVVAGGGTLLKPRGTAGDNGYFTWIEAPGGIHMVLWQHKGS